MPRLAGAMPKLRPSVSLPTMTSETPSADTTAVTMSGITGATSVARSRGGPASDSVVMMAAVTDRWVSRAGRRMTVSTTTSDSLTRRSRPVRWPVRWNSASRLIDISANSAPTITRAAMSRAFSCDTVCLALVYEVRLARPIEQLARDLRRGAAIAAKRRHLIEQVARMACAQPAVIRSIVAAQQVGDHHFMEPELPALAVQLENPREAFDARILDRDLVGNPAQERLVGQRLRIEVGREHREHVERHLEFLPGVQRQVVDAALERHDPAVEEILRPNSLAAEVVDEEHAAVRLQLNGRLVELRERVEREVELLERQLAADDDDRPVNAHPPAIARQRRDDARLLAFAAFERLVVERIEHRDDVAVDVDRMGNVHVAADGAAHAFTNDRLAVSRRPVQEHRFAGVHRRAKLLEHAVADDEMREAVAEPLPIDVSARVGQRPHVGDVRRQRHGHGADILVLVEILTSTIAAKIGQRVAEGGAAGARRAFHFDETLRSSALDERLQHRKRHAHAVGDRMSGQFHPVQRFDEQLLDVIDGHTRLFERAGHWWGRRRIRDDARLSGGGWTHTRDRLTCSPEVR